ncbi:glycosyltransferase family 2 protein [Salimicrobium album]|uniref:Glycosyltransferase involved in cell wall bisynthesis n=1 Tax=Salimicrobium album TaxID=50717 RepID=A0A1H3CWS5_9BACI|nr:glycosyltransferase family 2 protein [Salimicrobium album]SDX58500.1 Glycosyltransferase involved in cell wall bisynthesis [Salimicrobium album]
MQQPLVTVFIPMFNAEKYIQDTLESILNQSYKNLEVLVVDDGSSDRSVEIVKSYTDNRIRVVVNEENKGIPYTRNVGLSLSSGKYMAIMDADDESIPERIREQVSYMEENPDIDAVGSYYRAKGSNNSRIMKAYHTSWEEIRIQLMFNNQLGNSTAMIRMATVRDNGLTYNESYYVSQDYEFWSQLSKVGRIEILPKVLVDYRTGHSNATNASLSNKMFERKILIDGIHKDLLEHYGFHFSDEEVQVFNNFFFLNVVTVFDKGYVMRIKEVLQKLLDTNEAFDKELLKRVLRVNVLRGLSNSSVNLKQKTGLFLDLFQEITFGEMFHLLSRHYHKKVKAVL